MAHQILIMELVEDRLAQIELIPQPPNMAREKGKKLAGVMGSEHALIHLPEAMEKVTITTQLVIELLN